MKMSYVLRKTALAAAVALLIGGTAPFDNTVLVDDGFSLIASTAYADEGGSGGGHTGAMGGQQGGQGQWRGGRAAQLWQSVR